MPSLFEPLCTSVKFARNAKAEPTPLRKIAVITSKILNVSWVIPED